ncbi:glycosyltransferase family 25 protein [Amphritea sp. HPY]|uniref:glycosyltransferase family 25 protein n=1 Tax=Amphritea sp. HPY TaxID=3421652 RepID=UPI003D7D2402
MDIYVINLKKDTDKKEYIRKHFEEKGIFHYEFIEGVYGKDLSQKKLDEVYDPDLAKKYWGREILANEIGCALSHLKIYRKIIKNGSKGAFIFEDDVFIKEDNIMKLVNEIESHRYKENPIILFSWLDSFFRRRVIWNINNHTCVEGYSSDLACSYYISREAAEVMLLEFEKIKAPIDAWSKLRKENKISLYGLTSSFVAPADFAEDKSSISDDRQDAFMKKKPLYSRLWKKTRSGIVRTTTNYLIDVAFGIKHSPPR